MLHRLLKQSDWAFLLDFVSPAFFKVIPPLELAAQATALAKRTQNRPLYELIRKNFESVDGLLLEAGAMTQEVRAPLGVSALDVPAERQAQLAALIVDLYFAQLHAGPHMLLDLRLSRFRMCDDVWVWRPAPLIGEFQDSFSRSMCSLYEGFYTGKPELMMSSLEELGLEWAYETFIHHFGEGDQSRVEFRMSHFIQTFHDIFMRCKKNKKSLRGEFVQLGVALGLMYESLESLQSPVNVRDSYLRVFNKSLRQG